MAAVKDKEKETLLTKVLKRKKPLAIGAVVVIVILLFFRFVLFKKEETEKTEIKRGTVVEELILSGEIKADEHAELSFQASGKVSWVGVVEGESVEKGQALARLDATSLSMDLQIADANLRAKAASLNKVYDDLQGKEDSETFEETETRTAAETNKDSAVFSHIKAQKSLANATLLAPFDGIVTYVAIPFVGTNIFFTERQIEIVNPETIYFEVTVDQSEVVELSLGQKVKIILDSFPDGEFEGEVVFINYAPKSGEVGTVYKVKVGFPIESVDVQKFRIGMTGDAKFALSEKSDVLYVPLQFLNSDKNGKYLKLRKENNKVYVEIGIEGEERVEVIGDFKEGDIVYD